MKQSKKKQKKAERVLHIFCLIISIGSTDKNRRVYNRIISKKGNWREQLDSEDISYSKKVLLHLKKIMLSRCVSFKKEFGVLSGPFE